jgi:hypothetical protein
MPRRTDDLSPELATQLLMLYARGQAATYGPAALSDHLARLQASSRTDRDQLPTPLEALEHFGGNVERLVLLANPTARLAISSPGARSRPTLLPGDHGRGSPKAGMQPATASSHEIFSGPPTNAVRVANRSSCTHACAARLAGQLGQPGG